MKNEVYGNLNLAISMPVRSENESMAVLEANYHASDLTIDEVEVTLINYRTRRVHKVTVHNWDIEWERFFGENE
jgi:hypothetical protein